MKICLVQMQSFKGDVTKNIAHHMKFVEIGISAGADMIVFPELSLSGYEPLLAGRLAANPDDRLFDIFQDKANSSNAIICVGMPTISDQGTQISMLIFQPGIERKIYSKQILHEDELPYFVSGIDSLILCHKGYKIGFGICYESLQREHFTSLKTKGIDLYIASVAKPNHGVEKAVSHFAKLASEFSIPILMVNAVGKSDNFLSVGQSAIWDKNGILQKQLNSDEENILLFSL